MDKWHGNYVEDPNFTNENQKKIKFAFARQLRDTDLNDIATALESLLRDVYAEMPESQWTIRLNTFQAAFLISFLYQNKDDRSVNVLESVMKQLNEIRRVIRARAGVKVEKLPNGTLKMVDKSGTTIIRKPYEWENY